MKQTTIRGCNVHYTDHNPTQPETILWVHGHPFNHTMWDYQVEAFSDYRLLMPDLKGYGKSDYLFDKIYIEEQASDLALLLDSLGIQSVHLVGLSMGGQIITEFARQFPGRVKSMALCCASPSAENELSYANRLQLAEKINEIGMEAYTQQEIHHYLHPDTVTQQGNVYHHLFSMMANTAKEGAVASHKGRAERRDNYPYLPQINVPVLVVAGSDDFFTPVTQMLDIAALIPGATFTEIANSGHMPNMEQPAQFNAALQLFYNML